MTLSEDTHKLFADFFQTCELCEGFEFPKVEVYLRKGSWLLTNIIFVDGITIGRHIFINPKFVSRSNDGLLQVSKPLMAHELVHVLQYQKFGFWKFLKMYLSSFWKIFRKKKKWNLQTWFEAYYESPFEVEARDIADEFMEWNKNS